MASTLDRPFLRHNLLDEDDSSSERVKAVARRPRRLSRKSSHRNASLQNVSTPHHVNTTISNAAQEEETAAQTARPVQPVQPVQPVERSVPPLDDAQPQNPFRVRSPLWQDYGGGQTRNAASLPFPPPPDGAGRPERSKRLVIAIDYGTTYTGMMFEC